jgi:hypothetical protein
VSPNGETLRRSAHEAAQVTAGQLLNVSVNPGGTTTASSVAGSLVEVFVTATRSPRSTSALRPGSSVSD